MIAEIVRGDGMPDLISYLFGPGRHNEHVDQHLVAGYADAVFTAPDRLWKSEPGVQRQVQKEARDLGWQVEYPRSRWGTDVPRGHVWHCSLAVKADEGQLTDTQWAEAAHAMIDALGFSGADGKAPCRWVAVRHGPSAEGNDHIHIAVNLVREDGTKASTWNDYPKAGAACAALESRFGLRHVPGRMTGRSVPEPSRADQEISAARGDSEPLRTRLERKVRACAAAARSEAHFIALARAHGLLIRPPLRHRRPHPGHRLRSRRTRWPARRQQPDRHARPRLVRRRQAGQRPRPPAAARALAARCHRNDHGGTGRMVSHHLHHPRPPPPPNGQR